MPTRSPHEEGEWYHCYNRGVDKRKIFETPHDYERFLFSLYLANSDTSIHISNRKPQRLESSLLDSSIERGKPLVEIGAYCLMPNHFHLVLQEIKEDGIALFMQKLCTGYTMYFNKKYERTGSLLAGTFKSKHVADDRYLKHLIAYVHLNPAELFEAAWKKGGGSLLRVTEGLRGYPYSSLPDFLNLNKTERPHKRLLGKTIFELFESTPTIDEITNDAHAYYLETEPIKVKP